MAKKSLTLRGFEVEEKPFFRICLDDEDLAKTLDEYDFVEIGGRMGMYEERYVDVVALKEELEASKLGSAKARKDLMALCNKLIDGTICFYRP